MVLIVFDNILTPVSARGDVIKGIGKLYADGARHGGSVVGELLLS
jgi:hypothetical protein